MSESSFSGGEKLQAKLRELADKMGATPPVLRVGFLEGATYPDGQQVAAVAAFNNFGTSKSPPRPFFSNMVEAKKNGWGVKLGKLCVANNYDVTKVMQLMGEGISGQLRQAIVSFDNPADSAATLARKNFKHGGSATLIDTANMLNSISYEVSE